jgi:DnaJ-class molecular chaperone
MSATSGRGRPAGINPGDEVKPDTPQSGETVCAACGGSGRQGDAKCPTCDGTGVVIALVGDA